MNKEQKRYFEWLLKRIDVDDGPGGYSRLCAELMDIPFWALSHVPMDRNRAMDGIFLRHQYIQETGGTEHDANELSFTLGRCRVLEMMIPLAEKMDYILQGSHYEAPPGSWFREMLSNLGLESCVNEAFDQNPDVRWLVKFTIDSMVKREYGDNGGGGLFPLWNPMRDQRDLELTSQMNDYIQENYDLLV